MSFLGASSKARLATCHPDLQRLIAEVAEHINFTILCGHRTKEEQDEAVRSKKSKTPWPQSKHNTVPSQAVDVWPWVPEAGLDWKDSPSGARLMGYIQATADRLGIKVRFGMDWDGDWRSAGYDPSEHFYDGPHVELVL